MTEEDRQRKEDERFSYEILTRISHLEEQVDFLNENAIANLRDFFATSALSMLAAPGAAQEDYERIAKRAYKIADAMIKEREKSA